MPRITLERAQAAKKAALERFSSLDELGGVGITRVGGEYGVKVNLRNPLDPDMDLPTEIDGVPLRFEVVGTIRAR